MNDITKIKKVIELGPDDDVNEYLDNGWMLLDVHGGPHGNKVITVFILGWTSTKKPWQPE